MNAESIRALFDDIKQGKVTPDEAVQRMRHMPFEDLGFAKIDHHRALRNGMPEVIFGQGKTPEHVAGIFQRLAEHGNNVLATRTSEEQFAAIKAEGRELRAVDVAAVLDALSARVDAAVAELRTIDVKTLGDFRGVGRAQLPSTVIGCLVHGAEHAMRHVGQLSVTARIARSDPGDA